MQTQYLPTVLQMTSRMLVHRTYFLGFVLQLVGSSAPNACMPLPFKQVQEPLRKCRALHGELAALQRVMAGALSSISFNASAAGQLDDAARRLERRLRRVIALLDSCAAEVCTPGAIAMTLTSAS